jgi:hypothetical protein
MPPKKTRHLDLNLETGGGKTEKIIIEQFNRSIV